MCSIYTMKKRIQVSLNPDLIACAKAMMKLNKHGKNFSGYLEHLIREEWQRKEKVAAGMIIQPTDTGGTSRLNEPHAPYKPRK